MTPHDPDARDDARTDAERAVQDAVRGLRTGAPDPAFRARLRQDFVTGRFGRRAPLVRPWYARPLAWFPVAAAAVALIVTFANRGPDWRVVAISGEGQVLVDGVAHAPSDSLAITRAVKRGARIETAGALTLDLISPGTIALAIAPNARVTVPPAPSRWWSRHAELRLEAGDVYVSTGQAFHGATFDVQTPTVIARCVGTSFAVLSVPVGTCVCVMEGQVNVATRSETPGAGVAVPHGMRRVVDRSGHGTVLPILDDSVHHLHHQLSTVGAKLDR